MNDNELKQNLEDNVKEYFSKYARLKEATKTIESFDYSKKETVEMKPYLATFQPMPFY